VEITRRLGGGAASRQCYSAQACPNLFELANGDFLAVGLDVTGQMRGQLPPDAGCADDERVVLLPRQVLVLARPEIPAA
jgi:hypothetical protein